MLSDFFTKKSAKWTIIAGLGNPGREYAHTRHNVGFDTLDILSDRYDIPIDMARFNAHLGKGEIEGRKVILLKPQTYMNLSGESVSGAVNYYKADPETDLIVIYDDVYLGIGDIRIRKQGDALLRVIIPADDGNVRAEAVEPHTKLLILLVSEP